ncbi:MAG: nuclear transport factor 2 family protein [Xanthobacteraceae bacterium]|jgi:ketosteroid isomerase-like protein|nr:nuclear transport factor 2 family protein [Xanthobacteraceae bacterium]
MSEEARNVAILKEAFRLWHESKGESVAHWESIWDDSIVFGSIGQSVAQTPYMTMHEGRESIAEYFRGLARDWSMIEFRTEEFIAQGDRVVMLGRCSWTAKKSGKQVWTPIACSFRMKNGKVTEYYEYFDTAQMRDALQG